MCGHMRPCQLAAMIGTNATGMAQTNAVHHRGRGGRRVKARVMSSQQGPTASAARHSILLSDVLSPRETAAAPRPSARAQTATARQRAASQGAAGIARRRHAVALTVTMPTATANSSHAGQLSCHACTDKPQENSRCTVLDTIGRRELWLDGGRSDRMASDRHRDWPPWIEGAAVSRADPAPRPPRA